MLALVHSVLARAQGTHISSVSGCAVNYDAYLWAGSTRTKGHPDAT